MQGQDIGFYPSSANVFQTTIEMAIFTVHLSRNWRNGLVASQFQPSNLVNDDLSQLVRFTRGVVVIVKLGQWDTIRDEIIQSDRVRLGSPIILGLAPATPAPAKLARLTGGVTLASWEYQKTIM